MAKYKCPTLGDCDKANAGEIFERAPGEELKCPGCSTLLEVQTAPSARPGGKVKVLITAGVAVLILVAAGGYFYKKSGTVAPEPNVASIAIPVSASVVPDPAANTGIAPSDGQTKELRIQGDAQLASGNAAEAELASSKAAANEMLKVAIAKMAQGKLDEAEKDLNEARARAPKQPLVYYNMAILRLKQGRTDDALKEFEASFMAGFSYFDQMDQDSDLDGLRKAPRFIELVAKYRTQAK
jgi:tetratricopeptide (TPR) repeat protein